MCIQVEEGEEGGRLDGRHRKEEGESEDTPMFEFRLGCRFAPSFCLPPLSFVYTVVSLSISICVARTLLSVFSATYSSARSPQPSDL